MLNLCFISTLHRKLSYDKTRRVVGKQFRVTFLSTSVKFLGKQKGFTNSLERNWVKCVVQGAKFRKSKFLRATSDGAAVMVAAIIASRACFNEINVIRVESTKQSIHRATLILFERPFTNVD